MQHKTNASMSRSRPNSKQQTTLSPAVVAAVKDSNAKKQANQARKDVLHAQVARHPQPRTHDELMRAGLMLEQQRLRALCEDATNKKKLQDDLAALMKKIDENTNRRNNLNNLIKEQTAESKAMQERIDNLPEENTVRLELFGIERLLSAPMEISDEAPQDPQTLEWNGGAVFTPMVAEDAVAIDGGDEEDPLALQLLES